MMSRKSALAVCGAAFAVAASVVVAPTAASAETEYRRGSDPTATGLEKNGPFAYASYTVADSATPGFGAATIYYPTDTSQGTFGGVSISPGYTETQSAISWFGPRLSSHGFVVITFDTNSKYDQPSARADQLLAALDYLTGSSAVKDRVDPSRLSVMGHSMGGGGALEAAKKRPALQATIPLTPWHTDKTWPEVVSPSMIIGAEKDTIAPVRDHAEPFYESLPGTLQKAYPELQEAAHSATNKDNAPTSRLAVSWLKRFVDNDTRYSQFLCPAPVTPSAEFEEYRSTCPY